MSVGTDAITVYQGEDRTLTFTMDDGSNVTGWTLQFTVRAYKGAPTTLIQKAGSVSDGPNGVMTVTLTDDDTGITSGQYVYDFWRTDDGSETLLAIGTFTVAADVRE